MKRNEQALQDSKAARDDARRALEGRIEHIRDAVAERSIAGRILDEALSRSRGATAEAGDVVRESRWVVAGTLGLTAAWFCRRPLIRLVQRANWRAVLDRGESLVQQIRKGRS